MKSVRQVRFALAFALAGLIVAPLLTARADTAGAAAVVTTASSTITYAEAPGAAPNWIMPFTSFPNFSLSNINEFQQLMFRPLYFFGLGPTAALAPTLSLANYPIFSKNDKTVVIDLKGWRFADGQTVNADAVLFFLNLYNADPTGYGNYTPGLGIPDQLASAVASGNRVVLRLKTAVNPEWFLYSYLSEITPLPNAWDVTNPGVTGHCATGAYGSAATKASCLAVVKFLDEMSARTGTYTSKFWQGGVDGPWRLTSFDAAGNATFQANAFYSGPQKPQVKYFQEVAYTSATAEVADLATGKIDVGYVAPSDLSRPAASPGAVGPNSAALNSKYRLSVSNPYGFNFAQINFTPSNPYQNVFRQIYVRQALQESFDQASVLKNIDANYGTIGFSPLPPTTPPAVANPPKNPYPLNPTAAKDLLTSHGWTPTNGVMTCSNAGTGPHECGAGIAPGTQLTFTFLYLTGSATIAATVNAVVAQWAKIGVAASATAETFDDLTATCNATSKTQWSMCWPGNSWWYQPNYYPSGEQLFLSSGVANAGGYSDPRMNAIIMADIHNKANLSAFEQYAADQLPVLFMPTTATLVETSRALRSSIGWTVSALQNLTPEYWHY